MKKIYNKLVRDRIPEIIISGGSVPNVKKLNKKDYQLELKKKFIEESKELVKSNKKTEVLNELSDIYELLISTAKQYKTELTNIRKVALKKRKNRGGFEKRLFLNYVEENKKREV